MREASEPALKGVMSQLLAALLDPRIASLAQGAQITKSINMITVKLVESGEPTCVMLALMRLLREALQSPTCPQKFTELVMKVRMRTCSSPEVLQPYCNDTTCSACGSSAGASNNSHLSCASEPSYSSHMLSSKYAE